MKYKILPILIIILSVVSCKNNKSESYSEADKSDVNINESKKIGKWEKITEDDGFVWIKNVITDKDVVYAYDENEKLILGPFSDIFYGKDGFFHATMKHRSGEDVVVCSGIYKRDGKPIIPCEDGYTDIHCVTFNNGDDGSEDYYFSVSYLYKGNFIHGAISKHGRVITYPFSDSEIEYDNESKVKHFYGEIGDKEILIFKYLDDKGNLYTLGDYKTVYIVPHKKYSPEDGVEYNNNPSSYIVYKFKDFIIYGMEKYYKSSKGYQRGYFYSNNDSPIFVSDYDVKDEDFYYNKKITIYQFYYPNENNEIVINDKIKKERIEKFFIMASDIRTHHIEDVAKKQQDEEKKNNASAEVTSNNTFNQDIYYNNPNNNYSIDNTPRNPSRYPCRACHRNPGVCGGCDGTRQIKQYYNSSTGTWTMRPCNACGGTGTCHACKGDGWIDEGVDF